MGIGTEDPMDVDMANSKMEWDTAEGLKLSAALQWKGKAGGALPVKKMGPWVEKYRPTNLSDVAAHKDIVDTSSAFNNSTFLSSRLVFIFLPCLDVTNWRLINISIVVFFICLYMRTALSKSRFP